MQIPRSRITLKELFRNIPFHPFLLAAYPIVSLLAYNISQIYGRDVIKPLQIALLATAIILVLLRLLSRSWQIAGLLTSLLVVWFFVYGHLYNQLKSLRIFGVIVGRHRYLLVIWSVIILLVAFWLVKSFRAIPNLTLGLNIISVLLLSLSLIQVGEFYIRDLFYPKTPTTATEKTLISWTNKSPPPDIYLIILDGYGRSDAVENVEGVDNSAFLNNLQQLGFYVVRCSQSNYTRTLLSLA
ncbi:MAG TPA: hypothetical protein VF831_03995, partial [Anaerolineales bacterium]